MGAGPLALLLALWGSGAVMAAEGAEAPTPPPAVERALADLSSEDETVREAAVRTLIEEGDESLLPRLDEIRADADRGLRQAIKPVMDLLKNRAKLTSPEPDERRSAATDLGMLGRLEAIPWLEQAASREPNRWVRYTMEEAAYLLKLAADDPAAKMAAAVKLSELRSQNAVPALKELAQAAADPNATGEQKTLAMAATQAIERIEVWAAWAGAFETLFRGISLSSILLIMSIGLAIVFGLMGVINMAHGELMMVGAYATFVTQECFKAYLPPDLFDYYFLLSMPLSFLVAALFGLVLEVTVIRFLYGRPLETMLATWGLSLIMIQAARVYFGDLTAVVAPSWLSGGWQIMVGVYLPYNRLFIIALSIACVAGIYLLLFRSGLGLRVRAVMQNRNMSACLGIPTRKVDAYTFAFGSGLAGVAGCALTLIGNVEPGLGQNYIVDSFMVVVTGGVGKLMGTIVAALGIGGLNKLLEPSLGAVYGKVLILALVILFLQWRPSGLFAIRGRYVE
ncbi:MAG TPA: urea ABC transporter permease subunit UrtB [Nitrospiraceae bacterium]|jgi:urea transport system permease protein|nr:urea ABC transporter permease subunit UrtB [Nitrospiraceae bacterium]